MIDHTGVSVSNYEQSKRFYRETLTAIGYELILEFPPSVTGSVDVAGFGEGASPTSG
jgi:catechol 2,3-dioxygenase-like lactoylglutathione lyase family enzyme